MHQAQRTLWMSAAAVMVLLAGVLAGTQSPPAVPSSGDVDFHHVHMNVVDPEASTMFYVTSFVRATRFVEEGMPGVRSDNVLILFNKVVTPASPEWDTPFWHFGWNTPNARADHERLARLGVTFFRVPPPSGHMFGPDGNDIEIAPGGATSGGVSVESFNHVHLMSDAPLCAAGWYETVLGLRLGGVTNPDGGTNCHVPFRPRHDPANQIHEPNARLYAGNIMVSIYPHQRLKAMTQVAVDDQGPLVSPKGRVLDHIALSVTDVGATLTRLRGQGVKVVRDVHSFGTSRRKAAFIEGPDQMLIELVERAR